MDRGHSKSSIEYLNDEFQLVIQMCKIIPIHPNNPRFSLIMRDYTQGFDLYQLKIQLSNLKMKRKVYFVFDSSVSLNITNSDHIKALKIIYETRLKREENVKGHLKQLQTKSLKIYQEITSDSQFMDLYLKFVDPFYLDIDYLNALLFIMR